MSQFNGRAEKSVVGPAGSLNQRLERSVEKFPLQTSWITQRRLITEMITISRRNIFPCLHELLNNRHDVAVPVPEGSSGVNIMHIVGQELTHYFGVSGTF